MEMISRKQSVRLPVPWGHIPGLTLLCLKLLSLMLISLMIASPLSAAQRIGLVTFLERPLVDAENQQPVGLVVTVVEELMKRASLEYTMKFAPPKRSLLIAQRTPNHCVFPIDRSQEREVFFKWISPVLISRHGFYARPDRNIRLATLNDARPYVIGSYLGSGVGEYLASFGFTVDYATRNALNAEKLMRNRVDLWVSDTISARFLAKELDMPVTEPALVFYTSVRAMGCNLDMSESVLDKLQSELLGMYYDKTINRIYQQYDATFLK